MKNNHRYDVVDIKTLNAHEEIVPERLEKVVSIIKREECVDIPVIVDEKTLVILDGHHRYNALKSLGMKKVPVVFIDYSNDDIITVEARAESGLETITKEEIIEMGLSDATYNPKTTKHDLKIDLDRINVPLTELG